MFEKTKNKRKWGRGWPIFKKIMPLAPGRNLLCLQFGPNRCITFKCRQWNLTRKWWLSYDQCDQIWRNFATLAKKLKSANFKKVYLVFGILLNVLWQFFNCCKWPKIKHNLAIWSHCSYDSECHWDKVQAFFSEIMHMRYGLVSPPPRSFVPRCILFFTLSPPSSSYSCPFCCCCSFAFAFLVLFVVVPLPLLLPVWEKPFSANVNA